ncbi:MAG: citramalate synthase [Planctomycetaceae bacterium]|nr:citramalate synthase [Planctomycetaceae bacterium]
MPRIQLYDTTLRDGSQAEGINFSLQDKIILAQRLDELGFDFIEGGYPASNEKDAQFFQSVSEKTLSFAKISAFGMTRRKGIAAKDDAGLRSLLEAKTPYVTIVGKSSAFQAVEIIRSTREENLEMIAETVGFFIENGRKVIYDAEHFFDGWKADPDYSLLTLKTAACAGAETVTLCDTNGGSMPDEIAAGVRAAIDAVNSSAPCQQSNNTAVGIHTHNDCGMAVANSIAAVEAGATQVQGTINGFGERCGNADLIQVAAILALKKQGYEVLQPNSIVQLTDLSRFVYKLVNLMPSKYQPFVGKSAFAHKGGMHVSGIHRASNAYEHIDPAFVGNNRNILVSELSGRANIEALAHKYNFEDLSQKYHFELTAALTTKLLAEIVARENLGYEYELAEASLIMLMLRSSGHFQPHFELVKYDVHATSELSNYVELEGKKDCNATVKMKVNGVQRYHVSDGNGPIDALCRAMLRILKQYRSELEFVELTDFKVRVVNSESGTDAHVRVVIQWRDEHDDKWGTVGVSESIIEASWEAIADSFEYKLCK